MTFLPVEKRNTSEESTALEDQILLWLSRRALTVAQNGSTYTLWERRALIHFQVQTSQTTVAVTDPQARRSSSYVDHMCLHV